jgi:hypothetical protein
MAKPGFASEADSVNARHPMLSPSSSSNRVNRAPRSRSRQTSPSAVLALLSAAYASPLAANGYPLEPSETALPFLYPPFIHRTDPSLAKRSPEASTSTAAATNATPTPPPPLPDCQQDGYKLPDKYVLGDDNRWHKTQWSLYGSVYCRVSLKRFLLRPRSSSCPLKLSPVAFCSRARVPHLLQSQSQTRCKMTLMTHQGQVLRVTLPHRRTNSTLRPCQPVGATFISPTPITAPPSSSLYPSLSRPSSSFSFLSSFGDVNIHPNGIQKRKAARPQISRTTIAFVVSEMPKLHKGNGSKLRVDGEVTYDSLLVVGEQIGHLPRLRAM